MMGTEADFELKIVSDSRVPAVVVGGQLNGLGVVRSLALGGISSIVVDTTRRRAAMWSSGCRAGVLVGRTHGPELIDCLLGLQRMLACRPILILTDEMSVGTVSEHRELLGRFFRFHLPSREMVDVLGNKARFHEFAQAFDLPVPDTIVVRSDADIAGLSRLEFPIIIKPADKGPVHLGKTARLHVAGTAREAEQICATILSGGDELVAQEWIEGPDSNISFSLFYCGENQRRVEQFVGRKLASFPAGVGSTALCVAAPELAEELVPLTRSFIEAASYEGLGSLEFKWNARRRRFEIIEPTVGRTDWQEEIATLNGMNLPLIAYQSELQNQSLPVAAFAGPSAWRETFLRRESPAASELAPGTVIYDGYWRWRDPMPAIVFYLLSLASLVMRAGWITKGSRLIQARDATGGLTGRTT
jgi:predicted ATP-grasp superfamily ATP-dependent carboligase